MGLDRVPSGKDLPNDFNVVVEISMHSEPIKYEVDKESGAIFVDRFMSTAMHYPCNYGYIPHTIAGDGDPVDVLVLSQFALPPGVVVRCRPIGMLKMTDEAGEDAKLLAVPVDKLTPMYRDIVSPRDLPQIVLDQISHFFEHYKDLEAGKWVKLDGWVGAEEAKAETTQTPPAEAEVPSAAAGPAEEPQPEATEAEPQGPTSTLAEIYVQQGFLEKAIDIYKELVSAQPDNEEYKNRMDELLEKAYPEDAPAMEAPIEAAGKTPEKPAPAATEVELPAPAEEHKPRPEAAPAEDPFAQLFGSSDKKQEPAAPPVIPETSAPAPAQETKPEPAASPAAQEKAPEPTGDAPDMDFGALFNDAGAAPAKPEEEAPAAETAKPAPEAKPAEKAGDADDTVSSFQSWLSQIQK